MAVAIHEREKTNPAHLREPVGRLTFERSSFHQIGERIHDLMMSRVWNIHSRIPSFQSQQDHNEVIYLRSIYRRKERAVLRRENMKGGR